MRTRQHYIYIIRPRRAGFVDAPTPEEEQAMGEHFAYLKTALADGKLLMAGPCIAGADTFGIVVYAAESEAEAQAFMDNDPSVLAGVQDARLYPFRLSLLGDSAAFRE